MLIIDDNMFKLAKMQETLLRATNINRAENLAKYKNIVIEIDKCAYKSILDTIKEIDVHNHSLEEELEFLQTIKDSYDQLTELQLSFKKVYESYSADKLKLSNLTKLNIEYIENRISTINGYLINLKNIELNKQKVQELNDKLIEEEKKKETLDSRLLELERVLRYNFIGAEGRFIVNGQLQYTSVITEYQKIGFDFEQLIENSEFLENLLLQVEAEAKEIWEKLNAASICYNSYPNSESKQILNEINRDNLNVQYKLTMLKIATLLAKDCHDFDEFKNKREKLLSLIKNRLSYIYSLGINIPIDPFSRTKVEEQLNMVMSMPDNAKNINRIRKEIAELTTRLEDMIAQNNIYQITLNDTKELIKSRVGLSDVDISSVTIEESKETIEKLIPPTENQVVGLKDLPHDFKTSIVEQKTSGVIKRVCHLLTTTPIEDKEVKLVEEETIPELVIVPKKTPIKEIAVSTEIIEEPPVLDEPKEEDIFVDLSSNAFDDSQAKVEEDLDIFATTVPFLEPVMFNDREEESFVAESKVEQKQSQILDSKTENSEEVEMPELFWSIDKPEEPAEEAYVAPSFDDQIDMLLSNNTSDTVYKKERKLAA